MGLSSVAVRRILISAVSTAACGAGLAAAPAVGAAAPALAIVPSDPLYADQSPLQPDAAIGAPEAWKVSQGAGVLVAVLDTGVDESHRDLQGALWTNAGEVPGNGKDDDHDGYVDDVHGVDLVNRDGDPSDDEGHGTHVAGIIAARADGEGAVGLAPKATIMPVKVLDDHRSGSTDVVAEGIRYAVTHGANVINLSINGPGPAEDLRAAIRVAGAAGVTVVASAGNDGDDLGLVPSYPASFTDPAILAVGATKGDNLLADFSNFGRGVSLTAPGVAILSTSSTGGYELRSGTSMAAPEVAAGLALLQSARPDLSGATLRAALVQTALKPTTLLGKVSGGALDVAAALHQIVPASQWPAAAAAPPKLTLIARVKRTSRLRTSSSSSLGKVLITWKVSGSTAAITSYRVTLNGRTLAKRSGGAARGMWVPRHRGRITLAALAKGGVKVATAKVTVR
jgi:subtilisin family serine protease